MATVTVIFTDKSTVSGENDILSVDMQDALDMVQHLANNGLITRMQQVAQPDDNNEGAYVLVIDYVSILVGATITFIY